MPRALLIFEPPDGGVAENVAQLAHGLPRLGWSVEVAGPPHALPYTELATAGVPIHRLPLRRGYGAPRSDVAALRALVRLVRLGRHDLLHCHSSKAGVLARIVAALTRTPAVYSPHCFAFATGLGPGQQLLSLLVERMLGHLGPTVLCVCEDERSVALRARVAPARRLVVVHNGCPPPQDGLAPDPRLAALAIAGPVVGAVTALRDQKGLDVFVDAAPRILQDVPTARIALIGDGPSRDELVARAAALGLDQDDRFAVLPFRPPAARSLQSLDVFVLPSRWESFPIGVLEAMSCGVPQVVSDVGGVAEAVTPATGRLVAPGDPDALANAVVEVLGNPQEAAAMATASRSRHAENFGVESMVARTAAVYDTVLRTRGTLTAR